MSTDLNISIVVYDVTIQQVGEIRQALIDSLADYPNKRVVLIITDSRTFGVAGTSTPES